MLVCFDRTLARVYTFLERISNKKISVSEERGIYISIWTLMLKRNQYKIHVVRQLSRGPCQLICCSFDLFGVFSPPRHHNKSLFVYNLLLSRVF